MTKMLQQIYHPTALIRGNGLVRQQDPQHSGIHTESDATVLRRVSISGACYKQCGRPHNCRITSILGQRQSNSPQGVSSQNFNDLSVD